jgi:hypothetical protein
MAGDRAAAYLSGYFVRGKADAERKRPEPASASDADLADAEGDSRDRDHDAEPKTLPAAMGRPAGSDFSPNWSGIELARTILLAGPWPVAPRAP